MIAACYVGVEIGAASLVEGRIEDQVRDSGLEVGSVQADVESFPLLTKILLDDRVERVTVTMRDVEWNGIDFQRLRLSLSGVKPDRGALLGGEPAASSIRSGSLSGRVAADGPLAAAAELGEVPDGILPCDASIRSAGSTLRVSCALRPVPRELLQQFGILG